MAEATPQSGRFVDDKELEAARPDVEFPTKIERSDIAPHPIGRGETEIVLQRHGKYIRDREHTNVGSLTEEAQVDERAAAEAYFKKFLDQLPEDERDTVDVLFVASDTRYRGNGRRSMETGIVAQQAAEEIFKKQGIPESNIVNDSHNLSGEGGPRPMPKMREPQIFDKSPDFVEFLTEKYGDLNLDFWIAFEEDTEKEKRLEMGAEGPDEIADRMALSVRVLARYAQAYHKANPGRRLIIWADTHYDTISPFVKRDIFGEGKEAQLLVDYGAGITVDIDTLGKGKTEIAGLEYPVPVKK